MPIIKGLVTIAHSSLIIVGQLEQRLPRALPRAGPETEGGRLHQLHIPAPGVREGRVSGIPIMKAYGNVARCAIVFEIIYQLS